MGMLRRGNDDRIQIAQSKYFVGSFERARCLAIVGGVGGLSSVAIDGPEIANRGHLHFVALLQSRDNFVQPSTTIADPDMPHRNTVIGTRYSTVGQRAAS